MESSSCFVHPGLLNNRQEIDFFVAQASAGISPWKNGYEKVLHGVNNAGSAFIDHVPHPHAVYAAVHWFQPGAPRDLLDDLRAAYANTLLYAVNENPAHATKAIQILNAWTSTLTTIMDKHNVPMSIKDERKDYMLFTSYTWPAAFWTAEILRSKPGAGWLSADQAKFDAMTNNLLRPAVEHPGNTHTANWGSWRVCFKMSRTVYQDDVAGFREATDEFRAQVDRYLTENLRGEMRRDLWHSQMGIAPLLCAAEIAHKQGVDLYAHADDRLYRVLEYQTPFYLGDHSNWPFEIPPVGNGQNTGELLWNMYEMAYNHYHGRLGLPCPNMERALACTTIRTRHREPYRPEDFQRTGYGTLTHSSGKWEK